MNLEAAIPTPRAAGWRALEGPRKPMSGRERPLTSDEGVRGYIEHPLNENFRPA
jgi:hypothetical protein